MPQSALTPQAAIARLGATPGEVRAAVLLDDRGGLAAQAADDNSIRDGLRGLATDFFRAADAAGVRAGVDPVGRIEVSRPDGGVYGLRDRDRDGNLWTLVAITAAGALSSLVLYDMRMAVLAIGAPR